MLHEVGGPPSDVVDEVNGLIDSADFAVSKSSGPSYVVNASDCPMTDGEFSTTELPMDDTVETDIMAGSLRDHADNTTVSSGPSCVVNASDCLMTNRECSTTELPMEDTVETDIMAGSLHDHTDNITVSENAVSLSDFLSKNVLTSLSCGSREYSLLQEFLRLCPLSNYGVSTTSLENCICHSSEAEPQNMVHEATVPELSDAESIVPDCDSSCASLVVPRVDYSNMSSPSSIRQPSNDEASAVAIKEGCKQHTVAEQKHANKHYYCLFCDKPYIKLKQHLISQHKDTAEVAEMLSRPAADLQKYLLRLRNLGNHKHNCEVLRCNKGSLVVAYAPKDGCVSLENAQTYVPCPYCFGYYEKKQLWRHSKNRCLWKPDGQHEHETSRAEKDLHEGTPLIRTDCDSSCASLVIPHEDYSNFSSPSLVPQPRNDEASAVVIKEGCTQHTVAEQKHANKHYYCLFCDRPYIKLKQHLISQHKDTAEVAEMLSRPAADLQKYLLRLRNLGNHKHNCKVLRCNKGSLVVAYTPRVSLKNDQTYVPCPYCFGYYEKKQLWKHSKNRCLWKPGGQHEHEASHAEKDLHEGTPLMRTNYF